MRRCDCNLSLRFDNDVDSVEGGKRVIGDACSCTIVIPVNTSKF